MRKVLIWVILLILMIYMTGCLYEPEAKPEPALKKMVDPVENPMEPPEDMLKQVEETSTGEEIESESVEENKTVMESSDFTVNPTLDDSALSNSS